MTISLAGQTIAFLYSCALGAALCVLYDVFRALRVFLMLGRALTAVFDLLYFFLAAIFTFAFFMAISRGEIRGYLCFGELIGWLLYYETIGSWSFRLQNGVFRFLRRTVRKIALPFRRFSQKLSACAASQRADKKKQEKGRKKRKKRSDSAPKALATGRKNSV